MRRALRLSLFALGGLVFAALAAGVAVELYYGHKVHSALPGPKLPPLSPVAGVGTLSATSCAACHAEIAREWQGSAHGRATRTPLYRAELAHEGSPHFCAYCHAPLVEQRATIVKDLIWIWPKQIPWQRKNPRYVSTLHDEGVTCVACHQRDAHLVGPHDINGAPHPTMQDPSFGAPNLCATCHSLDIRLGPGLPRPVQDTLNEWQAYRQAGGDKQCIDCHMPDVGMRPLAPGFPPRKSRSHALRGPADVEFLRTGILVRDAIITPSSDGAEARLTIENGSGHRIPTAEPRRRVQVDLEALDESGRVIKAVAQRIERRFDPQHLVEEPNSDTTLLPRQKRSFRLSLDGALPPQTRRLRLAVVYYLWNPDDEIARDAGLDAAALRRLVFESVLPLSTSTHF